MFKCREHDAKFYIFDARRHIAATANRMAGKGGTENAAAYVNTELIHCNIDNIHVMRGSYEALGELVAPSAQSETLMSENVGGAGFFQKLEDCGWLRYIHLLLLSCVRIASKIHLEGSSCLVHCSDGWDRTAQLCSITQIMLDPYFRTLDGIATLIEKEWCSFGFKFNERCGHHADYGHKSSERSPIFVQFLDSLYQICHQFPTSFEFNEYFLVFLCDHQFSGLFGTFLCDYDKMKSELEVKESTVSIWSYVFRHKDRFINPNYVEFPSPIWPSYNFSKLKLWERFHMRWNPDTHPNSIDGVGWAEDWYVVLCFLMEYIFIYKTHTHFYHLSFYLLD